MISIKSELQNNNRQLNVPQVNQETPIIKPLI